MSSAKKCCAGQCALLVWCVLGVTPGIRHEVCVGVLHTRGCTKEACGMPCGESFAHTVLCCPERVDGILSVGRAGRVNCVVELSCFVSCLLRQLRMAARGRQGPHWVEVWPALKAQGCLSWGAERQVGVAMCGGFKHSPSQHGSKAIGPSYMSSASLADTAGSTCDGYALGPCMG